MNRQEKEQVVQSLKGKFQASNASFLVGYRGLNVAQMADLRKRLRQQGGALQVAKVTLIRRAVNDVKQVQQLDSLLGDQVALVFAEGEPPAIAKILFDFAADNKKLQVIGGCYESSLLDAQTVKRFASLPSREVLLAQLCGTLKAPMVKLVSALNMCIKRPLFVLKQIEKKKSSE